MLWYIVIILGNYSKRSYSILNEKIKEKVMQMWMLNCMVYGTVWHVQAWNFQLSQR